MLLLLKQYGGLIIFMLMFPQVSHYGIKPRTQLVPGSNRELKVVRRLDLYFMGMGNQWIGIKLFLKLKQEVNI